MTWQPIDTALTEDDAIIWLVAHKPPAIHIDFERRCLEMLFEKETNQ